MSSRERFHDELLALAGARPVGTAPTDADRLRAYRILLRAILEDDDERARLALDALSNLGEIPEEAA